MADASSDDARYLVTARKYRPALFKELVAQEHVTGTLKNALRLDRLAHAYLFSGPRGVGKTTAARILAKAINCTTPLSEREDEAEPCRTCDSCHSFEEGRSLNVFEIDAASNRKVGDVEPLLEKVTIPPQGGRKKVYIVDEVHMFSKHAFNAFLKTLEEPPPHVLFIFATTEPHNVPATVLSRCQRFDFRRVPAERTARHLHWICEQEGIDADAASLMLLARKGDGALRDALSAFDQAVSLCGTELRYDALAQAMGVVDADLYFQATARAAEGDSAGMLRLVEDVVSQGYDLQEFLAGFSEHLRNLLVAATMEDRALIEATDAMRTRYAEATGTFSEADLLRLLMLAGEAEDHVKTATQPRLRLEMALLKMAALPRAADLQQVLQQLDRLEAMAHDGTLPAAPAAAASAEGDDAPEERPPADAAASKGTSDQAEASSETTEQVSEPAADEPTSADEDASPGDADPKNDADDDGAPPESPVTETEEDAPAEEARGPSSEYTDLFGKPALSNVSPTSKDQEGTGEDDGDSEERDAATNRASSGAGKSVAAAEASPVVQKLRAHWTKLVQDVRAERVDVAACLDGAAPASLSAGTLTLAVPDPFSRRSLRECEGFLLKHLQTHLPAEAPAPSALHLTVEERTDDGDTTAPPDPHAVMQRLREEHPVVKAIFEEFGGEMAW